MNAEPTGEGRHGGSDQERSLADTSTEFEAFRSYLHVLAETQLHAKLKSKVDASDIVQQTLLQAYRSRDQFRGQSSAEKAGWLRRILGNVVYALARDFSRQRRDVSREQSIQAIEASSIMLGNLLSAENSSPSAALHREERAAALAQAMLELTEEQRRAIILKYWENASLADIAQELGKSTEAVAGLIFRGMKRLRQQFGNGEQG
ncbi:MAG: sigma-70 family RNA polymerase sigma factor [Planctomycetota bacterium]|nr:MAG: sigma-70 family RNA polymerase sigma factor [Planctomycetota bacterium]